MTQKTLKIGVLHYHFQRCGVRTVITNSLRSLITHGRFEKLHIDLISSDAHQPDGQSLTDELRQFARQHQSTQTSINQIEIPELAYRDQPFANRNELFQHADQLAQRLLNKLQLEQNSASPPYLLHTHNANLGKNPLLTLAIKILADKLQQINLPARILFQIHDFAQDHRPACWAALRDCSGSPNPQLATEIMFPASPRVLFACINSHDQRNLIQAGIDPNRTFVLPNSIDIKNFASPPLSQMSTAQLQKLKINPINFAADLKNRIAAFAQKNGYHFEPNRKILLSPIKTIRRKNVIESILLLLLINQNDDNYQLFITLPANTPDDLTYCSAVENFVKKNQLPVTIGFGSEILTGGHHRQIHSDGSVISYSLIDLLHLSSAVITTSIQEGFGYVFHEPWLTNKAVLGRNLPKVTSDFIQNGMNLEHLFDHLLIPKAWLDSNPNLNTPPKNTSNWNHTLEIYTKKILQLRQAADLPPISAKNLLHQLDLAKTYIISDQPPNTQKMLDWADLDHESQLSILQYLIAGKIPFSQIKCTDHHLNPIANWFCPQNPDIIKQNEFVVSSRYNLEAHANQFRFIIDQAANLTAEPEKSKPPGRVNNEIFFADSLNLKNLRLLV